LPPSLWKLIPKVDIHSSNILLGCITCRDFQQRLSFLKCQNRNM
jgi:hypothetical protein